MSSKIDFFMPDLISGHISKTPMFLESLISTSNPPKSLKMYLRQYWRNHIPVLTKSYTGIDEIIYILVVTKSYIGIDEIVYRQIYCKRFCQYRRRCISKILTDLRSNSKILKTWGALEICLDMGSIIKNNDKCPFKVGSFNNLYDLK